MWRSGSGVLVGAAFVFLACPARSQEQPLALVTDRPSFSESSATVPQGHLQLEFGLEYSHTRETETASAIFPMLRYGLTEGTEIRIGIPSIAWQFPDEGAKQTDLGRLCVGMKFVYPLGDWGAVGLSPFGLFPLKNSDYDSLGVAAGLRLVWEVRLLDWLGLAGNLAVVFEGLGTASARDESFWASLLWGFSLTDTIGLFAEAYSTISRMHAEDSPVFANGGLSWRVIERLQLDAYLGVDLNAPEHLVCGLGASFIW
ncbi:MAG: transporter [Deltaproteobacteria bacterium]|nr:transporter [Deltaproteobacteria bacterium]